MIRSISVSARILCFFLSTLFLSPLLLAQTAPTLGTTSTYGAFTSVGAINNTGLTQLVGDIGTNAGDFTGFPPGVYTGAKHVADPQSLVAKNDLNTAWNQLAAVACDAALPVTMGNGQVLTSQTYCSGAASTITGAMTFDAQGDPNAIFIVKVDGSLNVAATSSILLANGAQASNIYWRINGAVSILDNSIFKGTIISNGAISLYGGTTLEGRALSIVGAITMASNMVTVPTTSTQGSLTVIRPSSGEALVAGTPNYQIQFLGANVTMRKTLEYSLDAGATWMLIGTIRNDSTSYSWNIPDVASTQALVRITDSNGVTGTSGMFTIERVTGGNLVVVRPAAGEVLTGGTQNYRIELTGAGLAQRRTFEYSLDGGSTWMLIGVDESGSSSYGWNVPEVASEQALVRVTDANGVTGTSGLFTIRMKADTDGSITTLMLGGVVGEKIGNNMPVNISWTFTPEIGPSVAVEYSLDGGNTWSLIARVPTDGEQSTTWMTPASGNYESALIRVRSTMGMERISDAFSIGSPISSVPDRVSTAGFSITSFPNPAGSAATIRFMIPVRSDVTVTIVDGLGRDAGMVTAGSFEAGAHELPFDASRLAAGIYTYTLQTGTTRVSGMMTIVR